MKNYSMNVRFLSIIALILLCFSSGSAQNNWYAQENEWTTGRAELEVKKILNPVRILYVAAHPDDENTRLIAWLVNELHAEVAYLSMTKGSGGQNLVGEDIGEDLGLIREQELLAARRIDGGRQYFTSALDFGYSKSHDETFEKWNREKVLGEVVYRIRAFRPDVIITRFSPETNGIRSTHGHHTASAILAKEAFRLAADPNAYPEQLSQVKVWQANSIYWNTSYWSYGSQEKLDSVVAANPNEYININVEAYVTELGMTTSEIAARSRSMHKSQGFGTSANYGLQTEVLKLLDGAPVQPGYFNPGTYATTEGKPLYFAIADEIIEKLSGSWFQFTKYLEEARKNQYLSQEEVNELKAVFLRRSGLRLFAKWKNNYITLGEHQIDMAMVLFDNQGSYLLDSICFDGKKISQKSIALIAGELAVLQPKINFSKAYVQPEFDFWIEGVKFTVPLVHSYSDPVKGEIVNRVLVVPPILIEIEQTEQVVVNNPKAEIKARLLILEDIQHPVLVQSMESNGASQFLGEFLNLKSGTTIDLNFETAAKQARIMVTYAEGEVNHCIRTIQYEHLPVIYTVREAQVSLHYVQAKITAKKVAYVMGAGDKVPEAMEQMGAEVVLIDPLLITESELKNFDAVVFGIRALNTIEGIAEALPKFHNYAKEGGNLIFQYNTSHRLQTEQFMPPGYEITLSRDRVTEENSKVSYIEGDIVLNSPNKLLPESWDHWVQERGLYFPASWTEAYRSPLTMADRDADPLNGSLLIAEYGEGNIVYTGISFFRELPAGVEGAYQLWANILSL